MDKNAKKQYGYAGALGPLEQEILDVLWKRESVSGKDVFSEIKTKRPIALTTVLTVLERLCKKGLVKKVKGESVYVFAPAISRDEFARAVSGAVLKDMAGISASGVFASFADVLPDVSPAELEKLLLVIEKRKKELHRKKG
ncbi:MAG: BlaI/MecI/CopY family transcriptional regulator [Deltaproteobacteria bacterium]